MSAPKAGDLVAKARAARENAYSPYSKIKVGAAVLTDRGEVFTGCNIENASYGGTNCAERVAIQNAVSSRGNVQIKELAVVTDSSPPWPPCGLCLQVIAEFGETPVIHVANLKGENRTFKFADLLPQAFTPSHLDS